MTAVARALPAERTSDRLESVLQMKHLPALDGIRTISVLIVMLGHYGAGSIDAIVPSDLGVAAFFVLSGFLITRILLGEFAKTGDVSLWRFSKRRMLRIFPAYYVFVALMFAMDTLRGFPWPHALTWTSAFYLLNYYNAVNGHPTTSVSHGWSLAVEEQFYLLWPLVFLWLAKRGMRQLTIGLVVLIAMVVAWRSYAHLVLHFSSAWTYNAFDCRFDNLAVGCLLAVLMRNRTARVAASSLAQWWWTPLVTVALILWSRDVYRGDYRATLSYTVHAVLFAVLIVQLLCVYRSIAWSWLENPVIRYVGRISYPVYLYHEIGAGVGRHLPFISRSETLVVLASIAASIGIASVSYFTVERFFLRVRERAA